MAQKVVAPQVLSCSVVNAHHAEAGRRRVDCSSPDCAHKKLVGFPPTSLHITICLDPKLLCQTLICTSLLSRGLYRQKCFHDCVQKERKACIEVPICVIQRPGNFTERRQVTWRSSSGLRGPAVVNDRRFRALQSLPQTQHAGVPVHRSWSLPTSRHHASHGREQRSGPRELQPSGLP